MAAEFSFGTLNYLILFTYLTLMLGIGFRLSRRQTSTEEYVVRPYSRDSPASETTRLTT